MKIFYSVRLTEIKAVDSVRSTLSPHLAYRTPRHRKRKLSLDVLLGRMTSLLLENVK